MMTVKHSYANGGDCIYEANEVSRGIDDSIFIERPGVAKSQTVRFELAPGDTLYVMNERGATVNRYFGPSKPPVA